MPKKRKKFNILHINIELDKVRLAVAGSFTLSFQDGGMRIAGGKCHRGQHSYQYEAHQGNDEQYQQHIRNSLYCVLYHNVPPIGNDRAGLSHSADVG